MKVFSTHSWIVCSVGSLLQQQKSVRWSCAKSSQNISCLIFGKWQECQETMSLSRYCGLDWHLMFKAITWEVFQCSVFELSDLYPTLLNFIMLNIHLVFESIKECGKKRKLSCFLGIELMKKQLYYFSKLGKQSIWEYFCKPVLSSENLMDVAFTLNFSTIHKKCRRPCLVCRNSDFILFIFEHSANCFLRKVVFFIYIFLGWRVRKQRCKFRACGSIFSLKKSGEISW